MKKINALNPQASAKFERMTDRDDRMFVSPSILIADNGADAVYMVDGCYINSKSQFGDEGVIISGDYAINISHACVDSVKKILEDETYIDLINAGKMFVKPYSYISKKYNKTCYNVEYLVNEE